MVGKRRFAYEINKKEEGFYVFFNVVAPAGLLGELERHLRLADEVVRHKLLRLPDHGPHAAAWSSRPAERQATMADSTVTLVGNLTRDPELRFTQSGQAIATLGIAVSRRYQQNGEWQEKTSFFNITAWGQLGESGLIPVEGIAHHRHRSVGAALYETQDGEKRSVVEVVADEIGPSLRWATAQVDRNDHARAAAPVAARATAAGAAAPVPRSTTAPKSPSERTRPMPKMTRRAKPRDGGKKPKKKTSILFQERVTYVDYKDVNLLQRFVSDRSKIRARRVSGNDVQQQREVATAIKNAREMALLPYTKRVATQRVPAQAAATRASRPRRPLRSKVRRTWSSRRPWSRRCSTTAPSRWRPRSRRSRSVAKVILRADVDGVGKRATSARCRTATPATSCSLEGWPSRRATAGEPGRQHAGA